MKKDAIREMRVQDIEEALRRQYDAFAAQYDRVNQGVDLLLARLKLPPEASVLDIGCGAGNLTLRLPEKGAWRRVVGVDLSEGVLEIARRHAREDGRANFEFIRASACSLPFADAEFDAVVSNMVFHLIPDSRKAFSEILRVLKPAGKAVLQFQGGGEVAAEWMEIFRESWRHVISGQEPPNLIQELTAETVKDHLISLGIRDFDISWRHRTRRIHPADVPMVVEFGKMVIGFWRWGLADDVVRRIDDEIARKVTEKAGDGALTNTVNILMVQFQKSGDSDARG